MPDEGIRDPGFPYTERVEGVARLCLPCEDFTDGLYIHPESAVVVTVAARGSASMPEVEHFVGAFDFMLLQKERDELKRTLALINLTRVGPVTDSDRLRRVYELCDKAGFGPGEAHALNGVVAWALERSDG
jgi:hypothetical protein